MNSIDTFKKNTEYMSQTLDDIKKAVEGLADMIDEAKTKLNKLKAVTCANSLAEKLDNSINCSTKIQSFPYKDHTINLTCYSWIHFDKDGHCTVFEDRGREGGPVLGRHMNRIHQKENDREFVNSLKSYLVSSSCGSDTAYKVIDYISTLDWVVDRNKEDTTIVEEASNFGVELVNGEIYTFDSCEEALNFLNTHEYTRVTRKGAIVSAKGCGKIYKYFNYTDMLTNTKLREEKLVYEKSTAGMIKYY